MSLETFPSQVTTRYEVDLSPHPKDGGPGRNVLIFLDGTWNEERSSDGCDPVVTNVRKLYDALAEDSPRQIARYFRGVGNRQDNTWLRQKLHGINGADEAAIRESVMATLNKEYQPGDRIHIFGFSRGAACARKLAYQLSEKGLYKSFYITTECRENLLTRQGEARTTKISGEGQATPVAISFLGCWDTVGAFVLPFRFPKSKIPDWIVRNWVSWKQKRNGEVPFRDLKVASKVKRAVHCVAIDETRDAFLPTLMAPEDRIEEVWFPGVHADVGGGYARDGLARLSLAFMVHRFERHAREESLHPIEWDDSAHQKIRQVSENIDFDFHFHGLRRTLGLYGRSLRRIRVRDAKDNAIAAKPNIHWSVAQLWQSNRIYAERGKSRWRIDYRPFNITELNQIKKALNVPIEEWPLEWVDRPEQEHV